METVLLACLMRRVALVLCMAAPSFPGLPAVLLLFTDDACVLVLKSGTVLLR